MGARQRLQRWWFYLNSTQGSPSETRDNPGLIDGILSGFGSGDRKVEVAIGRRWRRNVPQSGPAGTFENRSSSELPKSRRDGWNDCEMNLKNGIGGSEIQPSRWDSDRRERNPGVETPVYFRIVAPRQLTDMTPGRTTNR
jgi:hypothetical protein